MVVYSYYRLFFFLHEAPASAKRHIRTRNLAPYCIQFWAGTVIENGYFAGLHVGNSGGEWK